MGAAAPDHVVLGPGGVFLVLVRTAAAAACAPSGPTRRARWPPCWRASRAARSRPWSCSSARPSGDDARRFHGVDVVPVSGLARYLVASGHVLAPAEIAALREALRIALAA